MKDEIDKAYQEIVEQYGGGGYGSNLRTGSSSVDRGRASTLTKGDIKFDKPDTDEDESKVKKEDDEENTGSDVEGEVLSKKVKEFGKISKVK